MKVLLCEDEKSLSKAIVAMLEIKGYDVDVAFDGEMAIEKIGVNNYDIIVSDIMMPKKDGITLLKEIREMHINIPVIMLTAKSEIDDKVLGLQSGANDYLTKPFAFKELLARIEVLTRSVNNFILEYSDLVLDKSSCEIKSTTGRLRLSVKEFEMIEMLINSSKGKISAARFFEKIWRDEADSEISVVCVYISYLQKKLKSIGSMVNIKIQDEQGYFLETL